MCFYVVLAMRVVPERVQVRVREDYGKCSAEVTADGEVIRDRDGLYYHALIL